MIYIVSVFMLLTGYYTFSYGIKLYKEERNKLGGSAVIALTTIGTIIPIIVLIQKAS